MSFSIIIPARDEENYILDTLNAIPAHIETIVVCNACADKTYELAQANASIAINTIEPGVSKARNLGAKYATNPILVFLDADVKISPDTLLKIDKALKKCVVGSCKFKPDSKKTIAKFYALIKNIFSETTGSSNGVIFCPKYVFDQVGGFNQRLSKREDHLFVKKAKKIGKYKIVNSQVLVSMRRYEKTGYLKHMLYWTREIIWPHKNPYPIIR